MRRPHFLSQIDTKAADISLSADTFYHNINMPRKPYCIVHCNVYSTTAVDLNNINTD